MNLRIDIPDDLKFSDLQLRFVDGGGIAFDWTLIEKICGHSGIPVSTFKESLEDNVAGLIVKWYAAHRANGGELDPVAEELAAEVAAEDAASFIVDTGSKTNQ